MNWLLILPSTQVYQYNDLLTKIRHLMYHQCRYNIDLLGKMFFISVVQKDLSYFEARVTSESVLPYAEIGASLSTVAVLVYCCGGGCFCYLTFEFGCTQNIVSR